MKAAVGGFYWQRKDRICANIIDYGILGLLILTPLPAASVNEWSVLFIQLVVIVMAYAYILMGEKPQSNKFLSRASRWSRYFFLGFFVFLLIQILPLPKFLVQILSPNSYNFQKHYSVDLAGLKFISLSIIPSYTFQKAGELLAYFLLGFLIFKTVTKRYQIFRILKVLIAMGVFEAFYGLFELYSKSPRILFYKKVYGLDSVSGTFVNRNHFSGYLEMIIPLAVGLIIARIDFFSFTGVSWREKILRLSERGLAKNLLVFCGTVLMGIAIVFSKSRSGVFILVFTFILFIGLTTLFFDVYSLRKKWVKNYLKAAILLIIFISLYVGIDAMLQRFSLDKLLQDGRPMFWMRTMRTFSAYPLFGTGLGTFGALYPVIEGETGPLGLFHAHNDYLEYLSELGLIGFGLLFGLIFYLATISFLTWTSRRHPEVKGLASGGIVSLFSVFVHSLTDFNLHIPANMVLFSVVLSLTVVIANYKRGETPFERE
jgi:O-antigen ligase